MIIGTGGLLFHIFATRHVIMRNTVLVNVSCAFQRNKNAITGETGRLQEQEYKILGDVTSCTLIPVARHKRIGETCCLTPHEFWYRETTSHQITSQNIIILKVTGYAYYYVPPVL